MGPNRTRSLIILGVILVLVAIAGAAIWAFGPRAESPSAEKLCERLASVASLSSAMVTLDPTTLGPQAADLRRAVDVAPQEIRADLETLATFVTEIADEVRESPVDKKAALTAALAARQDRVDTVTAAGRSVETWTLDNCGAPLRTTTTQQASTTTRR